MGGQVQLTTYTIPAHHTTDTNLLKSTTFKRTLKEYSDGAVTMSFSKLFQTSTIRKAEGTTVYSAKILSKFY